MAIKVSVIHYSCQSGCTPSVRKKRIGKAGSKVILAAIDTDVKLTFVDSPFQSGRKTFNLSANKAVVETVGSTTGHFEYGLSCSKCGAPAGPPEMIVP